MTSIINDLSNIFKGAWKQIPLKLCQDLIDSIHQKFAATILNRGYSFYKIM